MTDTLQNLLDRIEQDGVQKAEAKAAAVIKEAEAKAAALVAEAEQKAEEARKRADQESQAYEVRSRKALDQAARDTILTVEMAVTQLFTRLMREDVRGAMSGTDLAAIVAAVAGAYAEGEGATLHVSPDQEQAIRDHMLSRLQGKLGEGVEITPDGDVVAGFKISTADGTIEHDFSSTAIADALSQFVRPQLAELLRGAASSPTP